MKRIIVEDVSKRFKIGFEKHQSALERFMSLFAGKVPTRTFQALKNVSFNAEAGEIVGIIGENGSGKSTLLRLIAGIYPKDTGRIEINGKIISIIALAYGLKDRLTARDNIYLVGSLFGFSQKTIRERFDSIIEFSGLKDFVNTKLYQYSTGMLQRLAFSIAIHCYPDILLLDEVFEVGDEDFKNRSANKIKEIVKSGAIVLLVSHESWMLEKYCHRVIWMEKGRIVKGGSVKEILKEYLKQ